MSKKACTSKTPIKLKFNSYEVVARAVEEGASYGVQRAYKYVDNPTREAIAEAVDLAIMNALSEVIDWGDK